MEYKLITCSCCGECVIPREGGLCAICISELDEIAQECDLCEQEDVNTREETVTVVIRR